MPLSGEKIKVSMRHVLIVGLLAGLAGDAVAWGGKGHRLIASLAEERLTQRNPEVMKRIKGLLGPDVSLASIAVCADAIRDFVSGKQRPNPSALPGNCLVTEQEAAVMFPNTGSWHFVNIPVPAAASLSAHPNAVLVKACEAHAPCVISQIEHFTAQLKDKSLDKRTRAIALMFLVHLVGDVHQPLHAVARNNDRGGNDVFVRVGTHTGRLHGLWDSFLVEGIEDAAVRRLVAAGKGGAERWAWESYDAARKFVYHGVPIQATTFETPVVLPDPAYREAAVPVIKARLKAASIRLANLIAKALSS
jgi:hypothetical protein